jgi:ribosomal protein S27E
MKCSTFEQMQHYEMLNVQRELQMESNEKFTVTRVEPKYFRSRVLGAESEPPIAAGYAALHMRCNACGHQWRATKSESDTPGTFNTRIGFIGISCARCSNTDVIENPPLS